MSPVTPKSVRCPKANYWAYIQTYRPAGGYMGEGMLPIPEEVMLELDLMPEVWMREEEEASVSRNVLILQRSGRRMLGNASPVLSVYSPPNTHKRYRN